MRLERANPAGIGESKKLGDVGAGGGVGVASTAKVTQAQPVVLAESNAAAAAALLGLGGKKGTPGERAAVRELAAHAAELGITLAPGLDVAAAIQAAELDKAQSVDARVTVADMERAALRSQQAWALKPVAQRDLFGFTRVVDAKVSLSAAGLEALAKDCAQEAGGPEALRALIDRGPPGGGLVFQPPSSRLELVASLVRQIVRGAGASRQLTLTPQLSAWVEQVLAGAGAEPKKAMGGAGAFAANLTAALGLGARFFSAEPVPQAIAERFAPGVQLVDKAGHKHAPHAHVDASAARVNTSVEYSKGLALTLFGATSVRVDGEEASLQCGGAGRVILGSQAKDIRPGLAGVTDATLEKLARDTDVFFFVGAHYLTQADSADAARADAEQLAGQLKTMKAAHPALLVHAQYVVPKKLENEAVVWAGLRGGVDSLALNAVEVAPFVDSLHDAGLADLDLDENVPRAAAEDPAHMLEGALALGRALELKRVHLHGFEGDLVVSQPGTPGAVDPTRQTLALVRARQIAANKAANDSGELKVADDIWPLVPSAQGTGLAAVHRFADAIAQRFGLSASQRELVVERWWFKDEGTGAVIHFVPSRGIHDRSGGTVSLGDTIDATGLLFAHNGTRPRLKHGSSFA
jgi:ADP-dependent phosphofructokinase/glucokinase